MIVMILYHIVYFLSSKKNTEHGVSATKCESRSVCLFGMDWYGDLKRSEVAMLGLKMRKGNSGQIRISKRVFFVKKKV